MSKQTGKHLQATYVLTISKVAILINSENNRTATRLFSKATKVTLHTVVLTCFLFSRFGYSNPLGDNYLLKSKLSQHLNLIWNS